MIKKELLKVIDDGLLEKLFGFCYIARALIHECQILLVDEGTSVLDQTNADIVEENLLSNPDLTLILISHHLSEERKRRFTKVYELGNYA